jgi:hypothetical protein
MKVKTRSNNKTWRYAGVSKPKDKTLRFRVSNKQDRELYLVKLGEERVKFQRLPFEMTHFRAAEYLLNKDFAAGDIEIIDCLTNYLKEMK